MAEKRLIYTVEVKGTEAQVNKLNELEVELKQVTTARNQLIAKQVQGQRLTREEEAELTRLTQREKELQNSKQKLNQEIRQTINLDRSQVNTLRQVNAELAVQRNKIQDVVIGSQQYRQIAARIKELEQLQRNYNKEIGRGNTFVGEYAKGAINAFSKIGVAAAGVMAAYGTFSNMFGKSIQIYKQAERAELLLTAAIKNRGETTKLTTQQLGDEASRLSKMGAAGRTDILKGVTTQLLTFRNISDEIFTDVQKTVLDVATVLSPDGNLDFGQLKTVAIQLGKALNEPEQALSALTRSGIQFSKEQKEMIKTLFASGDALGAQKMILEEVNRQYGTAYEQTGKGAGQFQMVAKAIKGLQKEFGAILSEYIAPFAGKLAESIRSLTTWFKSNSDVIIKVAKTLGILTAGYIAYRGVIFGVHKVQAAYNSVLAIGSVLKTAFGRSVKAATTMIYTEAGAIETTTVAQKGLNAAMKANPIGLVIGAITTLITVLSLLPKKARAAEEAQGKYNDALQSAKQPVIEQATELKYLLKIANDEKRSLDERREAIKRINEITPDYIENIDLEKVKTGQATQLINDYVKAQVEQAKQTALLNRLKEISLELDSIEDGTYESKLSFWQKVQTFANPALKSQMELAYETKNTADRAGELNEEMDSINAKLGVTTKTAQDYTTSTQTWAAAAGTAVTDQAQTTAEAVEGITGKAAAGSEKASEQMVTLNKMTISQLEDLREEMNEMTDDEIANSEEYHGITSELIDKIIQKKQQSVELTKKETEKLVSYNEKLQESTLENVENQAAKSIITEQQRYKKQVEIYETEIKDVTLRNNLIEQETIKHLQAMQELTTKYGVTSQAEEAILQQKVRYEQTVENLAKEYGATEEYNTKKQESYEEYIREVVEIINLNEIQKASEGIYKAALSDIDKLLAAEIEKEKQRWAEEQLIYADNLTAREQAYAAHLERMRVLQATAGAAKVLATPIEQVAEEAIPEPELDAIVESETAKLELIKSFQDKGVEILTGSLAERKNLLDQWYKAGKISEEQYNKAITTIQEQQKERRSQLMTATLQGIVQVFGESTKIGRAAVIAERAFGLAEATIALFKGMSKTAAAVPFPANIPLIAGFIGQLAAMIASIKAVKVPEIESPKVRISKFALGGIMQRAPKTDKGQIVKGTGAERSDNILAMVSPEEAIINARSMKSKEILTVTGTPAGIASEINSLHNYGVKFAFGKAPVMASPPPFVIRNEPQQVVNSDLIRQIVNETVAGVRKIPVVVTEYDITSRQRLVKLSEKAGDL